MFITFLTANKDFFIIKNHSLTSEIKSEMAILIIDDSGTIALTNIKSLITNGSFGSSGIVLRLWTQIAKSAKLKLFVLMGFDLSLFCIKFFICYFSGTNSPSI